MMKLLLMMTIPYVVCAQLTSTELELFRPHGVIITEDPNNASLWIFNHSGLPSHPIGPFGGNPNEATEQDHMYRIPKTPVVAATPGCLTLGVMAVAVNGVPFFNPYSGDGLDAVVVEALGLDACNGHPQQQGTYHYHAFMPSHCGLHQDMPDELMGVSLDGYPIYGPLTLMEGIEKNLTNLDLDPCNGWMRNGRYEYRITHELPYIQGCYHGIVADQGRRGMGGPGGNQPPQGNRTPPTGGNRPRPTGAPPTDANGNTMSRPRPTQPQGAIEGDYAWTPDSCIYATYCKDPVYGCQCAAYVYDSEAPRTSGRDICQEVVSGATQISTVVTLLIVTVMSCLV